MGEYVAQEWKMAKAEDNTTVGMIHLRKQEDSSQIW